MKKQLKKIRLRHIVIAVLLFFLIYFAVLLGGSKLYLYNKYDKDFKFVSMRLPYYPDTADFFDWPIFYKPGEKVPFTVYYTDGDKNFTVIHQKFKYFDDYQLEEISKLSADYFRELTGCEEIETVLFSDSSIGNPKNHHFLLHDILENNNQLWNRENISDLIDLYFNQEFPSGIQVVIHSEQGDATSISNKCEIVWDRIFEKYYSYLKPITDQKTGVTYTRYDLRIIYTNHNLDIERISASKSYCINFDWYGFANDKNTCSFVELIENGKKEDYRDFIAVYWEEK